MTTAYTALHLSRMPVWLTRMVDTACHKMGMRSLEEGDAEGNTFDGWRQEEAIVIGDDVVWPRDPIGPAAMVHRAVCVQRVGCMVCVCAQCVCCVSRVGWCVCACVA